MSRRNTVFVDIAVLASIYVLLALGYIVVYRTSRILNFAHGDVFMVGGYLIFTLVSVLSLTPMLALPASLAGGAVAGILVYLVLMAPMAGHSIFAAVLVTIGLGIIIRGVTLIGYSGRIIYPGRVFGISNEPIALFGNLVVSRLELYIIASAVLAIVILLAFFRYSSLGIRMRAASEDSRLATFRGINIHALFALAWAIATSIAIYTSALYSFNQQVNATLSEVALRGLAVALVGGMDSIKGAVPAALLIAALEIATQRYVSPQASEAVPFLILVLVLLVRPWGFFGTKEAIDRI
jgi:branched-chain amino acid transport system permease protein